MVLKVTFCLVFFLKKILILCYLKMSKMPSVRKEQQVEPRPWVFLHAHRHDHGCYSQTPKKLGGEKGFGARRDGSGDVLALSLFTYLGGKSPAKPRPRGMVPPARRWASPGSLGVGGHGVARLLLPRQQTPRPEWFL